MKISLKDTEAILGLVQDASQSIIEIYNSACFGIEAKKDNSPVTLADKASHAILASGLNKLYPDIPVLSEEAKITPYAIRKEWECFWLIDPLDGTKEFILKNGEFTINLALIQKNKPVFGVVAAPAKKVVYFAGKEYGPYKKEKGSLLKIKAKKRAGKKLLVARTRSHKNKKEDVFISRLRPCEAIYAGSALKFCLVAEGRADIYLRGGPTMEWDTAAGQCIAAEAGAETFDLGGNPFLYNKKSLLNPGLVCTANKKIIERIGFYG